MICHHAIRILSKVLECLSQNLLVLSEDKKTWELAADSCKRLGDGWYLPFENKESLETVTQAMQQAGVESVWTGIKLTKDNSYHWQNGESKNGKYIDLF